MENYGDHDTKLSDQKEPQTSQNTVQREKSTDLEGYCSVFLWLMLYTTAIFSCLKQYVPYRAMCLHSCESSILLFILCRVMISIAEQLYSVLLLTFFLMEVILFFLFSNEVNCFTCPCLSVSSISNFKVHWFSILCRFMLLDLSPT